MPENSGINKGTLIRLRSLVRAMHEPDAKGVPLAHLVELAGETGLDVGVTVDFEASRELGEPLLILRVPTPASPNPRLANLSEREKEVAELVAQGLSNKQIAVRLRITLATVKDHVHRILHKTGLPNRAAVAAALKG